jgi:hypothetical protein
MAMDASADPVVRSSDERIERVAWTLRANNIEAIVVDTAAEARYLILELSPRAPRSIPPCRRRSRTSGRSPSCKSPGTTMPSDRATTEGRER